MLLGVIKKGKIRLCSTNDLVTHPYQIYRSTEVKLTILELMLDITPSSKMRISAHIEQEFTVQTLVKDFFLL